MDLAGVRFIRKAFIKERGAEVLEISVRPLSCKSPLKIPRHLAQLLAIRILIAKGAHSSVWGLLFTK